MHRLVSPLKSLACAFRLTLKSSPMTWPNDVIYFHRVVWMWFIMWTVPKQIPVTSTVCAWRLIQSTRRSGACWTVLQILMGIGPAHRCCNLLYSRMKRETPACCAGCSCFQCSIWVWEKLVVLFVFEEGKISCAFSWFVVASLLPSHIPSSLSSTTNVCDCVWACAVGHWVYLSYSKSALKLTNWYSSTVRERGEMNN